MIKYFCKECNTYTETSECGICGSRTIMESKVFWCPECNVPTYEEVCERCHTRGEYLTTDVRPVFPEEKLLLSILLDDMESLKGKAVWNGVGNRYFIDGKRLKNSLKQLIKKDVEGYADKVAEKLNSEESLRWVQEEKIAFEEYIKIFIDANKGRYEAITSEALDYISEASRNYSQGDMFVSFSGGKDSTVTSHLAIRGIGTPRVIHIFGDTTLEFPKTMEYVERFKKANPMIPMLSARNKEQDFMELCDQVGPPSRVMRWCCTIFKTGAITRKIDSTFKNKKSILTFYGVRRSESASRSKYDRESDSPKIAKQKVVSPIIDWIDFDVWLYMLTTGIDFNDAYRYGYTRVGCWCCPNNSDWSAFLSSLYMTEQYKKFHNFLVEFARRIGKEDAEVYVRDGKWKARQGGNGIEHSKNIFVEFKPCATQDNTFDYQLTKPITPDFYEFFKPFGFLNFEMGNKRLGEVYVLDRKENPVMKLQGRVGSTNLKVSVLKVPLGRSKTVREVEMKIQNQLTKYQICLACLGCESACKHDAIKIKKMANGEYEYRIKDEKCIRCGECITHYDGGCYMRKVLITKRG